MHSANFQKLHRTHNAFKYTSNGVSLSDKFSNQNGNLFAKVTDSYRVTNYKI